MTLKNADDAGHNFPALGSEAKNRGDAFFCVFCVSQCFLRYVPGWRCRGPIHGESEPVG